jgi:hypothetical protein
VSKRGKGLTRIAELYSTLEQARSAEMQRATFLVAEVEQAITLEDSIRSDAKSVGREALERGDRVGWLLAEGQSRLSDWSLRRLGAVARERNMLLDAATELYQASRIESEKMRRLLETSKRENAIVDGRKLQAAADDRFLSRRQWRSLHDSNSNAKV